MALTTEKPREAVEIYKVLTTIAQGLKDLSEPKALEAAIKVAYELPEAEQAKADAAREKIVQLNEAIAEQKRRESELEVYESDLNAVKKQLDEEKSRLAKYAAELDKRSKAQEAEDTRLAGVARDLSAREQAIEAGKTALDLRAGNMADREKAVDAREEALKAREEKLKAIIGG